MKQLTNASARIMSAQWILGVQLLREQIAHREFCQSKRHKESSSRNRGAKNLK